MEGGEKKEEGKEEGRKKSDMQCANAYLSYKISPLYKTIFSE